MFTKCKMHTTMHTMYKKILSFDKLLKKNTYLSVINCACFCSLCWEWDVNMFIYRFLINLLLITKNSNYEKTFHFGYVVVFKRSRLRTIG